MMVTAVTLVADPTQGRVHQPVAVQIRGAVSHRHRPAATIRGAVSHRHHVADLL